MKSRKNKSITANAILNTVKTLMSVIFPLITFPYAARILHADNLGKVSFAQSIVSYFSLIAMLGINTYAVREGAKLRDKKEDFNKFFNEIIRINIVTTIISYAFLLLSILIIPKFADYRYLILLISISIGFTTIGIEWVNVVYEEYLAITIRSIIIQLINLVLLFAFVKNESDYYIYAFLTVFSNIFICIWNAIHCRHYVKFQLRKKLNYGIHLKPLLILFANNLAITIYCNVDSTMLGWMLGDYFVGIYAVAIKVYSILKSVFAAIYIVCIPRLSNFIGNNDEKNFKKLLNDILSVLILVLIPAMAGIIVLSKPIIIFLSGVEYIEAVPTLKILGVALSFAILGGFITNCAVVPRGKEKIALKATIIAAIINIVLNFAFIPIWKQNGAAFTTATAELAVAIVCLVIDKGLRKLLDIKKLLMQTIYAAVGCLIVVGVNFATNCFEMGNLMICCFTFVASLITYFLFLIIAGNSYIRVFTKKIFLRRSQLK